MFKLRTHQKKQNKLVRKAQKDFKHILYGASTGFGKSVAIWDIVGRALKKDERVLVLAPFRKLIFQLEQTFATYEPHVIMGTVNRGDRFSGLVLASMDTMNNRLKKGDKFFEGFDLIIIDEAHISCNFPPKPNSRMELLYDKYWQSAKWLGFSATPIRENGYRLEGWDKTIYKYQTGKLIKMGFLANYIYKAPVSIDLSSLRVANTGDYVKADMEAVTNMPSAIKSVKKLWKRECKGKKSLIFASSIHHAQLLADAIPNSDVVHSKLGEKKIEEVLAKYDTLVEGTLINVDMLTTGFDSPSVEVLIIARPIRSERVYIQVCGRVLRKFGDKVAKIFDMCDCYTVNKLPCDIRDYNRVKGEVEAIEKNDLENVLSKKCALCNEVSPTSDYEVKKKTTKKSIVTKWYCPSCGKMCDLKRQDLTEVDEYQIIEKTEVVELTHDERKSKVAELVTEFTNANVKWSHFIVRIIKATGRAEMLDQSLGKDITNKTKWKHVMDLYSASQNEKEV